MHLPSWVGGPRHAQFPSQGWPSTGHSLFPGSDPTLGGLFTLPLGGGKAKV